MIRKVMLVFGCLLLCGASSAFAQQDTLDLGVADTIEVEFSVIPDATTNQLTMQMDLYFFNHPQNVVTAGVGFFWDNPNMQMDSAVIADTALFAFNLIQFTYRNNSIDSTNKYQQFQFSAARQSGLGLPPTLSRKRMCSYYFTLSDWSVADSIVIDTVAFSGGTVMAFVDPTNTSYVPYWTGRKVIRDTATPSNIVLTEDTLVFNYTLGGPAPASQTFDVLSDNEPLSFTLTENASWLLRTPSSGITPETITVSTVTVGLTPGIYFDSIRVAASQAGNSPQYLYVRLNVNEPPPLISVDPDEFVFSAVAGGSNPSPQVLTITNGGASTLEWAVTNSEAWLDLAPTSGTDSGDVTLSVDITGLTFGDYFDTIVVSDPDASNDPVEVEVKLQILSDLPLIEVDSVYNFVFALSELPFATRDIEVRNGGGGSLNFWIEKKPSQQLPTPVIVDFDPDTSTADDFVTITWQGINIPNGRQKADTLLVFSNQAANSPFEFVVNTRWVTSPNVIQVSDDTVSITVYECDQGFGNSLPSGTFDITNGGGDNPMGLSFDYISSLFTVSPDTGVAPQTVTITALTDDLAVGTYYDTITVTSIWALNSPQQVIVEYNVVSGDQTPEILIQRTDFTWPYRDGTGPLADSGITIFNVEGGCMPWTISEDVDWLIPSDTSGNVVGDVDFIIIPQGLTVGEYVDTIVVTSAGASNSPYVIEVKLQLWNLIGDWNWDGQVTLADLTLMLEYLFYNPGNPPPQPIFEVGNTDCEVPVDITLSDLTLMIDYLYISLTPLCDNPF